MFIVCIVHCYVGARNFHSDGMKCDVQYENIDHYYYWSFIDFPNLISCRISTILYSNAMECPRELFPADRIVYLCVHSMLVRTHLLNIELWYCQEQNHPEETEFLSISSTNVASLGKVFFYKYFGTLSMDRDTSSNQYESRRKWKQNIICLVDHQKCESALGIKRSGRIHTNKHAMRHQHLKKCHSVLAI